MNSLWLERISAYRNTPFALESAKELLEIKDARRTHILKRYRLSIPHISYMGAETYEAILLREARNAKAFWAAYTKLLPSSYADFKRRPHNGDIVNQLLDIGYHHMNVQEHIGHFLTEVNATAKAPHYLKDFKQCHAYRYYMELQIVKFIKAVNRKEIFEPILLPRRHDSRCVCGEVSPLPMLDIAPNSE